MVQGGHFVSEQRSNLYTEVLTGILKFSEEDVTELIGKGVVEMMLE